MANSYIINTGNPRSVTGNIVSGALSAAIVSGTVNYVKAQKNQMNASEAVRATIKRTTQGGIATGTAISAANHLGPQGDGLFKALSVLSIGMAGIYAVEMIDQTIDKKASAIEDSVEDLGDSLSDDSHENDEDALTE